MATPILLNDYWSFRTACWNPTTSQLGINDYVYKATALVGLVMDTDVINAIDAGFAPVMKAVMTANTTYLGSMMSRLAPVKTNAIGEVANTGVGTVAGDTMPGQVSAVLSKNSLAGGRRARGRTFVPFVPKGFASAWGDMTAGARVLYNAVGAMAAAAQNVVVGGNSVVMVPVVFHRATSLGDTLTAVVVSGKFGTQHRRGDYDRQNSIPGVLA